MNKMYKLKWHASTGAWIPVSEISRGKTKKTIKACAAVILSLSAFNTYAAEISEYNPTDNDDKSGQFIIESGSSQTLTGGYDVIESGLSGYSTKSVSQLEQDGRIVSGHVGMDAESLTMPSKAKTVTFYDRITGTNATVKVYDSSLISGKKVDDTLISMAKAVGDEQYTDMRIATVQSGADLSVNVGSTGSDWMDDPANHFSAIFKESNVYDVEDGGTLNYASKTILDGINAASTNGDNSIARSYNYALVTYAGNFNAFDGSSRTVSDVEALKQYNDYLIAAIENGELSAAEYESELSKAYSTTTDTIVVAAENISPEDDINKSGSVNQTNFMHASGRDAVINIASDASVQELNSKLTIAFVEKGATFNNYGELGVTGPTGFTNAVRLSNAQAHNYGVIDVGTGRGLGQTAEVGGSRIGFYATGASTVVNEEGGIMNVAGIGSQTSNMDAVEAINTSNVVNHGIINVASVKSSTDARAEYYSSGIDLSDQATATNTGEIYVGRKPMGSITDLTEDIPFITPVYGINAKEEASVTTEAGSSITIGSLVQGAAAIKLDGDKTSLMQSGDIIINGANTTGGASRNVGIYAVNKAGSSIQSLVNTGTIDLNGINGVGIAVESGSQVLHDGIINVNGSVDPSTQLMNYGIYAKDSGSTIISQGDVNLNGDNAIGIHARDGASIELAADNNINFANGVHQIGYYIYGDGTSLIDNSNAPTPTIINTPDSILMRIDGGAEYVGSDASSLLADAAGNSSAIIQVTGKNSSFDSGAMTLTVSGIDATALRVEGGAEGTLTSDAIINLSANGATAGIVDGKYYTIMGDVDEANTGHSKLTSQATLNSTNVAEGAYGYIVQNGGELVHQGKIVFEAPDSTGIKISSGEVNNSGEISVNGTAIHIIGENSTVTNTGLVDATDGTAAYHVDNGASLILAGKGITQAGGSAHGILLDKGAVALEVKDATITIASTGTGNAIENTAEIADIHLDNTTINVGNGAGVRTSASLAAENSGIITVTGNGTGLKFETATGDMADNAYDMSKSQDLVINVTSAHGKGMTTNTTGSIKTGISVNIEDAAGGSALVVGGESKEVDQSGNLVSQSTQQVVDINNGYTSDFINSGTIASRNSDARVMTVDKQSVNFTNSQGGILAGKVDLLEGDNTVTLEHGSQANSIFTTGKGNDKFILNDIVATENDTLFTQLNGGDGYDTVSMDNSDYRVRYAAQLSEMERVDLQNNSTLRLDDTIVDLSADGDYYNIDETSTLLVNNKNALDFDSHLKGNGTMYVDLTDTNNTFAFTANNAEDGFAGKVELANSNFLLDSNASVNNRALSAATLVLGEGNATTIAKGTQQIGGLAFNGGTAIFDTASLGNAVSDAYVETSGILDISGEGKVQVDTNSVQNGESKPDTALNLLQQDDAQVALKLAGSTGQVTTYGGNLQLIDSKGNSISDATTTTVEQNGVTVANATYDYRLTSGEAGDGLFVNYGLKTLELLTAGEDALALNSTGLSGAGADMSAQITGVGDLSIDTGKGNTVSLSNISNDYSGVTDVRSGTLLMANDNVLGQTSELHQTANTLVDMNGHSQTIGKLNTEEGSTTNINGGNLTVEKGGEVNGSLEGEGELHLAGGKAMIYGANAMLSAISTISSTAEAVMNDVKGLGNGAITNDGQLTLNGGQGELSNGLSGTGAVAIQQSSDVTLTGDNSSFSGKYLLEEGSKLAVSEQAHLGTASVINHGLLALSSAHDWTLANSITGRGDLSKSGVGTVTLSQKSAQYTGTTDVIEGGLQLGNSDSNVTLASTTVNVAEGAIFGGYGSTAGDVINAGTMSLGDITTQTKLMSAASDTAGQTFTVGNNLTNSGTINLSQMGTITAGNTLHIKGNYVGNGGTLNLNTQLGGDDSLTDKLEVEGNTSGATEVAVTNAGGTGASTLNGIEVISVGGKSDGEFTKKGRIVAGAYDYDLVRGKGEKAKNWYLTNNTGSDVPIDPINPVDPIDPSDDDKPSNDDNTTDNPTIRPEGKAYATNMAAANTLFNMTLHDRLGETHYVDPFTKEEKVTSLWLRQVGGHTRSQDGSGQNKTQANRYVAQLGGDIGQWSSDAKDRFHLGVMGGYANQRSNTRNHRTGYSADASVEGYSVGLYGTWFQNNEAKTGAYVDTWMLYNWFDNTMSSKDGSSQTYKSKGMTASIESGYTWKIGEKNDRESYYIQPQAQVTWMNVGADDLTEGNGTHVQFGGDGNVQTRLGVRTFIKGHSKIDNGKERTFEPFIEANWIHNTKDFSATMDGVGVRQAGTRNIGELKAGVEAKLNKNVNLWGNVGQQIGDKGYSDTQATVGFKVNF